MHVVEGEEKLLDGVSCLSLRHAFHLDDVVVELATGHQLGSDVEIGVVVEQFKNADNVWVICLLEHVQLLLHQVHKNLVLLNMRFFDDLEGADDPSLPVSALVDLSKGSFSEDSAKSVLRVDISGLFEAFEEAELEDFPLGEAEGCA